MGISFTEKQQRVIDARGHNLLVSAAAGSGKTAVLVERIVRMVSDSAQPVDIDRLLVVTFTNAAAAEMRERISRALNDRLAEDPENEHLQRQTTLLHNAKITTIDSFCLFVLRNQFHTIGLDPGFRIAEEGEVRLMRQEVLEAVLEERYAAQDPDFLSCMEYFSVGSRDKAVEEIVLKLYDFAMSTPFPERWLQERKQDYPVGVTASAAGSGGTACAEDMAFQTKERVFDKTFEELPWVIDLISQTRLLLAGCIKKLAEAIRMSEEPDGPYMYGELLEREKEMVEGLLCKCGQEADFDSLYAAFGAMKFDRLPSKRDETVSVNKREVVKGIRTQVKEQLGDLQKRYFFMPKEQVLGQMKTCGDAVSALTDLTLMFKEAFDARKRDKNILDFDDIEHFALSILVQAEDGGRCAPTETALAYRSFFHEILIDEYQDSNLVQEYILSCISGEDEGRYNRFMVGDVKQSIYKFRLARPELFLEKYEAYGKQAQGSQEAQDGREEEGSREAQDGREEEGSREAQNGREEEGSQEAQDGKEEKVGQEAQDGRKEEGGQAQGGQSGGRITAEKIDLHQNFRSRREVLESTNTVFEQIMGRDVGGIVYDDLAALHPGAVYPVQVRKGRDFSPAADGGQEGQSLSEEEMVHPVEEVPDKQGEHLQEEESMNVTEVLLFRTEEKPEDISVKEQEAYGVAAKIKEMMREFQVTDREGTFRQLAYRDIVILLRTTSGWDDVFKQVLEQEGIPVYMTSRTGYFAAGEVQELLHFLRVLDNPLQDIPLYGVLHAYLGGFAEEEIALIRAAYPKKKYLFDALCACGRVEGSVVAPVEDSESGGAQSDSLPESPACSEPPAVDILQELAGRIRGFLERIDRYRRLSAYLSVQELLQVILRETDYLNYVAARPEGGRRRANVEMLLVKAADYEKTSYFGLYHFLRYMEQLEKYEVDYGEAALQDENADVVRIMSIHRSKGLEFPVCFVSGLAKGFQTRDVNGHIVLDIDAGVGVDYVNPGMRVRGRDLRRNVIAEKLKVDNLAEEMRILYVAMTRAKEKLILTGTIKSPEKTAAALLPLRSGKEVLLPYDVLLAQGSFLELILAALARNRCMDEFYRACGLEADTRNPFYGRDMCIQVVLSGWEERVQEKLEESIRLEEMKRRLLLSDPVRDADGTLMTLMSERFAWCYPYENLSNLYTKTTVSELKMAGMQEETDFSFDLYEEETVVPYLPGFLEKDEHVSGSMRGSAFHKVMELFDFTELTDEVNSDRAAAEDLLRRQLAKMRQSGRLSEEYRAVVSVPKIACFLMSRTARRMGQAARAGRLYKEQPFVMGLPANRLHSEFPGEETVLIQGIIDVFFEENGRYVLLDYKTDAVRTAQELAGRYHVQLDYYAEALKQSFGCEETEKVLYSFKLEEEIYL